MKEGWASMGWDSEMMMVKGFVNFAIRLVIAGTLFPHKNIHKATCVSPNRITRNQNGHVLIRFD